MQVLLILYGFNIKGGLKMKKKFSFILLTVSMILVVGCTGGKANYEDGLHSEEAEIDDRGWKSTITITVVDGKIKEVDYDEVNEEGISKTKDTEYAELMKKETGISPEEAFQKLEKELKLSQDVDKVDVVSGATSSSNEFKSLAKEALGL